MPGTPLRIMASVGRSEGMSSERPSHVSATSNLLSRFTMYDLAVTETAAARRDFRWNSRYF